MKCPKCHYLSFDPEPRCKNCGYSFSLGESDLALKPDSPSLPLADFDLRRVDPPSRPATPPRPVRPVASPPAERRTLDDRSTGARSSLDDIVGRPPARDVSAMSSASAPSAPAPAARTTFESAVTPVVPPSVPDGAASLAAAPAVVPSRPLLPPTTELPLFVKGMAAAEPHVLRPVTPPVESGENDEPLVKVPVEPRVPLGVRRTAPDSGARKVKSPGAALRKMGPLDRDLLEDLHRIEKTERTTVAAGARAAAVVDRPADRASAGARLASAAIDAIFLSGVAALVVWVVLRWSDVALDRSTIGALWPVAIFLILIGVGYLFMFTAAGGQTIGKMLVGIRVVEESSGDGAPAMVSARRAISRALLTVPSVLALGAGFVPALVGENRAVHDRLAHTRVVRA